MGISGAVRYSEAYSIYALYELPPTPPTMRDIKGEALG
jgi:hypothetical protein